MAFKEGGRPSITNWSLSKIVY